MGLSQHITPRSIVPLLNDNTVAVRGLNLDDFSALLQNHLEPISKAVALYQAQRADIFATNNLQQFVLSVVKDFPGLVMEVISIASDEPEARDIKLGIGLQLTIVSEICKLTLEEAGGLGNLIASLAALGKGVVEANSEVARQTGKSTQ